MPRNFKPSLCSGFSCKHYQGISTLKGITNTKCQAFPEGIPNDFDRGHAYHIEKMMGQTGEYVFSPTEELLVSIEKGGSEKARDIILKHSNIELRITDQTYDPDQPFAVSYCCRARCQHALTEGKCKAYPDGIPDNLYYDFENHYEVKPGQTGDFVFSPTPKLLDQIRAGEEAYIKEELNKFGMWVDTDGKDED